MHKTIKFEEAQALSNAVYIDMRSPSEYKQGHIPGAINIPIFNDEERCSVGTTYKQQSQEDAKKLGLTIVSQKLPFLVEEIKKLDKKNTSLILYCWRGGMRSKSIVTILELMGIRAYQLVGGYKLYRRYVLDKLENFEVKPEVIVLSGSTGVGKTIVLKKLQDMDFPVVDLEKLAKHRGSAFGHIGLGSSQTAQIFDSLILDELENLNNSPYIIVECESKRIGNVYLPEALYNKMQTARKILLFTDVETRIDRLIEEYMETVKTSDADFLNSIKQLAPKFGKSKAQELENYYKEGNLHDLVYFLLVEYYDPLYGYEKNWADYKYKIDTKDIDIAIKSIISILEEWGMEYCADCRTNTKADS